MTDKTTSSTVNGREEVAKRFPTLDKALEAKGYEKLTLVQEKVIAPALEGHDLLVSAKTGSGKTVAFGLAFASDLLNKTGHVENLSTPQVLVIAPTRELAQQVRTELEWLYKDAGARVVCCIGGSDARQESRMLSANPTIVVGTPGRLCDHLKRGHLKLDKVKVAVLDEADEMLDMGFRDELELLLDALPAKRRSLFFSATMAQDIVKLATRYQNDAIRIAATDGQKQHTDITYECIGFAPRTLEASLVNILRYHQAKVAMIFCNTRMMVKDVQTFLVEKGFSSVAISGEMGQNERTRAIESLKQGLAQVCVATDVAARGIDIPELSLVIHTALPKTSEALLHRSGRTGRAGRKGTSILMLPYSQRMRGERLLQSAKIEAKWINVPTYEDIVKADAERIEQSHYLKSAPKDSEAMEALVEKLSKEFSAQDLASAFIRACWASLPKASKLPVMEWNGKPGSGSSGGTRGGWFEINKGKKQSMDPRSFLSWMEDATGLSARDIGDIRVQPDSTVFEVKSFVLKQFEEMLPNLESKDTRIQKAEAPADAGFGNKPRRPRGGGERGGRGGDRKFGGGGGRGGDRKFGGGGDRKPRSGSGKGGGFKGRRSK